MLSKFSQENYLHRIKIIGTRLAEQSEIDRAVISKISETTGISKPYLYQIRDGKRKNVGEAFLIALEKYFGIYAENKDDDLRGGDLADPGAYTYLPVYSVKGHGGGGNLIEKEKIVDALAFKISWINQELLANRNDLFLIYMEGESMEPTLHAKDILLVDRRDNRFSRESIYVIREDEMLLVKRVRQKDRGVIQLISDNPAYPPREIDLARVDENGFQIVGRVVWIGRRI